MNIWVIRSLWILGAVALIAEMFLLANPRYRVPPPSEWETFESKRFSIRKPKRFRAGDVTFGQLFGNLADILATEDVGFYRGRRTGFEVYFRPLLDSSNPLNPLMSQSNPNVRLDWASLMRKRHDERLAALRDDPSYVDFKELGRSNVAVRGVRGIRSDYEYVLPHPIPLFNMRVRGYLFTAPISEREVIHIHAYCPASSYETYQKVFDQMLATLTLKSQGGAP
jgi:hypothetical protein